MSFPRCIIDTCYTSGAYTNGEVIVYVIMDTDTNTPLFASLDFSRVRRMRDRMERDIAREEAK